MTEARKFHLGDILSVISGKMLSPRLLDGLSDILRFMTSEEKMYNVQAVRASDICGAALLELHPQLRSINFDHVNKNNVEEFLEEQIAKYGEALEVTRLASGEYIIRSPEEEIKEMAPKTYIATYMLPDPDS